MKRVLAGCLVAPAVLLGGCEQGGPPTSGWLTLGITDAPVDRARAVVVQFTGVEIKPAGRAALSYDYGNPRAIDLRALEGGRSELLLDGMEVPAGAYEWLRLKVDASADGTLDSYIELDDGSQHELVVPSGELSGLKLHSGFTVPAGGDAGFTVDFDLRRSVHEPMSAEDAYTLRPTLRLVDNARVGAIAGSVAAALVPAGCEPAVYVFAGSGVVPDDLDALAPEAITTARVGLDAVAGQYVYRAAFLEEGVYTVSYTCDAGSDRPATSETLVFAGTRDVAVGAHQTAMASFTPP